MSVGFRHADGSTYGRVEEPLAVEAQTKTFSALRNLGFREGDVRAVLTSLREEGGLALRPSTGCGRHWGGRRRGAHDCEEWLTI